MFSGELEDTDLYIGNYDIEPEFNNYQIDNNLNIDKLGGNEEKKEITLPTLLIRGNLRSHDIKLEKELKDKVPIEYIIEKLNSMKSIGIENRFLIIKAETSAGKSTVLPAQIYINLCHGKSAKVICFQPTILTAIDNVRQLTSISTYKEYFKLGQTIGWSTGSDKLLPRESSALISATIGTLTMYLKVWDDITFCSRFKYVLIDEIHERSIDVDICLALIKKFLMRNKDNPNCPYFIIMSATFEPQIFLDFFGLTINNFIWVGGRSFPCEEKWDWNEGRVINNMSQSAADIVLRISKEDKIPKNIKSPLSDILIFMPGNKEASDVLKWILPANEKLAPEEHFSPLSLKSEVVAEKGAEYHKIVSGDVRDQKVRIGKKTISGTARRVIIGTAIAETGITLDNLKYVIDSGFSRTSEYNPIYNFSGVITKPATQSKIIQRKGRVGRKFAGIFYPLYPKYIYDMLEKQNLPQVITDDPTFMIYTLFTEDIRDIDLVTLPPCDSLMRSYERLALYGFIRPIGDYKFELTNMGKNLQKIMLPPHISKMIYSAYYYKVSILDMISIAAYISYDQTQILDKKLAMADNVYEITWTDIYKFGSNYAKKYLDYYKLKLLVADEFIDGIFIINTIKNLLKDKSLTELKKWTEKNYINFAYIVGLIELRDKIIEEFLEAGFDINNAEELDIAEDFTSKILKIKYCIWEGFKMNFVEKNSDGKYKILDVDIVPPKNFAINIDTLKKKEKYGVGLDTRPNTFLYSKLEIKLNRKTSLYELVPQYVSILDGYIQKDDDFF